MKRSVRTKAKIDPRLGKPQAGHQANCLDLVIATSGLEESGIKFTLDKKREWTPAEVEPTGIVESNGDTIFRKTKVSDHLWP